MIKQILKGGTSLLFGTLLFACGEAPNEAKPRVDISTMTPLTTNNESTFQSLQGGPLELSNYLGKKVVLNYWATWCAPCIREIPALNRAADILKNEDFVFLLASDESIEEITEFVEDHEFKGNFIKLNAFFASFGVEAVPSTILYNSEGEIINTWLGDYEWDSPQILEELRKAE